MEMFAFLVLGALAGGFINGFAGTGTALFSLGFFLAVLPPAQAVAVVATVAVLSGLQGVWVVRGAILAQPGRAARFVIPGLLGVPLGVYLLRFVDASVLRIIIAVLLVAFGALFGFRKSLPQLVKPFRGIDVSVALVGGVLGGMAALSGALPTIWLSMRAWPKAQTRAVLQSYNVSLLLCTIAFLLWNGVFTDDTWLALAVVIPVGLVGSQVGIQAYKRLSDGAFRRALVLLCFGMGLGIFADLAGVY